jgi:hypothetical protein
MLLLLTGYHFASVLTSGSIVEYVWYLKGRQLNLAVLWDLGVGVSFNTKKAGRILPAFA